MIPLKKLPPISSEASPGQALPHWKCNSEHQTRYVPSAFCYLRSWHMGSNVCTPSIPAWNASKEQMSKSDVISNVKCKKERIDPAKASGIILWEQTKTIQSKLLKNLAFLHLESGLKDIHWNCLIVILSRICQFKARTIQFDELLWKNQTKIKLYTWIKNPGRSFFVLFFLYLLWLWLLPFLLGQPLPWLWLCPLALPSLCPFGHSDNWESVRWVKKKPTKLQQIPNWSCRLLNK